MTDTSTNTVAVNTNIDPALAAIRAALVSLGTLAAAKGYIDSSDVTLVAGAIVAVISAGWSIYSHFTSTKISSVAKIVGLSPNRLKNNIVGMRNPVTAKF